MTLKNSKLSQTNKNLLDNFNLGEELEDKNGEKITGGAIFSFVNRTNSDIEITLLDVNTDRIITEFTVEPSRISGTQIVNISGKNQITVRFNEIPGLEVNFIEDIMTSNQTGIFDLEDSTIVLYLE